jgi:hypothetical protein
MSREVKRLIKKLALFLLPFGIYGAVIIAIDPYNYFSTNSFIPGELKQEISFKLNYALWRMVEYKRQPSDGLLLGDSRMMAIQAEDIRAVCGQEYYNFAYGGGSLKEALATFRFANDQTQLRRVAIGLDINTYNGSDTKDRVAEAQAALRNPLLYVTNNNVMLAAWKLVVSVVTRKTARIGEPVGDRESFWRQQLDVTARVYLENYRDPAFYRNELAEISAICRAQNIQLDFIIFPSHQDLMSKIGEYALVDADRVMREDLAKYGRVFDFAWKNSLTADRASFTDPFHFTHEVSSIIVRSVWAADRDYVHVYGDGVVPASGGMAVPEPDSLDRKLPLARRHHRSPR